MRGKKTIEERFWSFVKKTESCWIWKGYLDRDGYGQFGINSNIKKRTHRFSYELVNGKISMRLEIDHLCKNRNCVNPDHLEPVTYQENIDRGLVGIRQREKTHCPKGHEYSNENPAFRKDRYGRICKICRKESRKKFGIKIMEAI